MSHEETRCQPGLEMSLSEVEVQRLNVLIGLVIELCEDENHAKVWIQRSHYGLAGKRPVDMISTEDDFQVVCDLIGRLKHGVPM